MSREPPSKSAERFRTEVWPLMADLLRLARILTGDEYLAEDLVQETMLRAYRGLESWRQGTNMRAWLLTIMRNLNVDRIRKQARQITTGSIEEMEIEPSAGVPMDDIDPGSWPNPDELLERFSDDQIEAALRQLPDSMRWVLLLVDVQRLSVVEAAAILGVAEGTVKSRASRARAVLRKRLLPLARDNGWLDESVQD
ncbi:MAG: RNA polymerase sigma factor [Phycisphaeraceae bacterium]|nr:RNA polymerase sigma factor [Phycisphaeraceae bacterium]